MKFGLGYANTIPFTDPAPARDLAQAAEEAGFESIWTVEHVIWPHEYTSVYPYHRSGKMPGSPAVPIPDPLVWLTWVGAATSSLRLGTGVVILPQRNALVLAKEVATLDHLTAGRVELGIGVGWLREEFEALGVEFGGRGERADEMIAAMRVLWADESASYQGSHVSFEHVALNPKPVNGTIPIVVGGSGRRAARRAAELGDGFYPGPATLDDLEQSMTFLAEACEAIGRPRSAVEVSAAFPGRFMADPTAAIDALTGLGVDRIIVPAFEVTRPDVTTGMAAMSAVIATHAE